MSQTDTKHFNVLRNGKLTRRIEAILDHYRGYGMNVEVVLERELRRLEDRLVVKEVLQDYDSGEEPASYIKAKIQAIKDILSVLNS